MYGLRCTTVVGSRVVSEDIKVEALLLDDRQTVLQAVDPKDDM